MSELCLHKEKTIEEWILYFSFDVPRISSPTELPPLVSRLSMLSNEANRYYLETKGKLVSISLENKLSESAMAKMVEEEIKESEDYKNGKITISNALIKSKTKALMENEKHYQECLVSEKEFWYDLKKQLEVQMDLMKQASIAYSYNKDAFKGFTL